MRLIALFPIAALGLAACEATPPTINTSDIADFNESAEAALDLPTTDIGDLPAGTVSYFGEFGSNANVEGGGDAIVGQMEMTVQFASQDVGGQLYNVNLIDNGTPQQLMGGTLDIDGVAVNGVIVADAEGTLTRVEANKTDYAFTELELIGTVQSGLTDADVVSGSVTGSGDGSFDFVLDGNGTFYGVAEQ